MVRVNPLLPPPEHFPRWFRIILGLIGCGLFLVAAFGYPAQVVDALSTFGKVMDALDSEALRWIALLSGLTIIGYLTIYSRLHFWYYYKKQYGRPREFKQIDITIDGEWVIFRPQAGYKPNTVKAVATDVIITNGSKNRRTFDVTLLMNQQAIPGTPDAEPPHISVKPSRHPSRIVGGTRLRGAIEFRPLETPITIDDNSSKCGYLEFYINKNTIKQLSRTKRWSTGNYYWILCALELQDRISEKSQYYGVLTIAVAEGELEPENL